MTKTTTKTSRSTIILSWVIASVIAIAIILLLWLIPTPENKVLDLSSKEKPQEREIDRRKKEEQSRRENKEKSQRPLPDDFSKKLVRQSEVQVKRNLQRQLTIFKEISGKVRQRKNNLLTKVEDRKLSASAPADANNTSSARNISQVDTQLGTDPSVEELNDMLKRYETEIQENHLAMIAAKRALSQGYSFPEVYGGLEKSSSKMSTFEQLIDKQTNGKEWKRSPDSRASAGLEIKNTNDLNNYRELLGLSTRQAGLAGARLEGLLGTSRPVGTQKAGLESSQDGSGDGDGGMDVDYENNNNKTRMNEYKGARLDKEIVEAQALPGRRFSKSADRKGWLYVNTWYIIGPWETHGRDDFAISHQPEISVDLDAVYTDGKKGTGTVETDSDPLRITGEEVELNGKLEWEFMQSESMHNTVPVTTGSSAYYAYTELYFDEATNMLVAIGTDDSGRLWINGENVWEDTGASWYNIDEHITSFQFRQGWNKVLVRLENNGGGATGFSFLIIPPGAINSSMVDE